MDAETLERLVIDRHAGALSADAARLLDAWLATRPEQAAHAADIDATLVAAAQALKGAAPAGNAPPPAAAILARADVMAPVQGRRAWPRRLALAASVALAFHLGTRMTPSAGMLPKHSAGVALAGPAERDGGFWSRRRLMEQVRSAIPSDNNTIHWSGPLRRPQLGGAL